MTIDYITATESLGGARLSACGPSVTPHAPRVLIYGSALILFSHARLHYAIVEINGPTAGTMAGVIPATIPPLLPI